MIFCLNEHKGKLPYYRKLNCKTTSMYKMNGKLPRDSISSRSNLILVELNINLKHKHLIYVDRIKSEICCFKHKLKFNKAENKFIENFILLVKSIFLFPLLWLLD